MITNQVLRKYDMKFQIRFVPNAENDLDFYSKREQQIILDGIRKYLEKDADAETKRHKKLRPNLLAPWE